MAQSYVYFQQHFTLSNYQTNSSYAPSTKVIDYGALIDRADQRGQLSQTGSSATTQCGLTDHTGIGKVVGGSTHTILGIEQNITIRGGNFSQDHRSPFSVVASLVPSAQRSRHSIDEVSKFEGAPSKSIPEGKGAQCGIRKDLF